MPPFQCPFQPPNTVPFPSPTACLSGGNSQGRLASQGVPGSLMAAQCSQANTQPSDSFPASWATHVPAVPIAALADVGRRNRTSRIGTKYSRLILRSQLRCFHVSGRPLEPQIWNVSGDSKSARSTFLARAHMPISFKTSWYIVRFPRAMLVNARVYSA